MEQFLSEAETNGDEMNVSTDTAVAVSVWFDRARVKSEPV